MEKIANLEKENQCLKESNSALTEQVRSQKMSETAAPYISHLEVSNLPYGATEQMLKSLFGKYGTVGNVTMLRLNTCIVGMLDVPSLEVLREGSG